MGSPKQVKPVKLDTNYNWGSFGSADKSGVNLNPTTSATVGNIQSGIGQYLDQLISPSYDSEVFNARQALLDQANNVSARMLGANAIERGARGSATQAILNNVMANRANQLYSAMSDEDARVRNVLSAMSGLESNYFNQANTMANNILQRQLTNAERQTLANATNTGNYNAWKNNMLSGGAQVGGIALGAALNSGGDSSTPVSTYSGATTNNGMYGTYNPNDPYLIGA